MLKKRPKFNGFNPVLQETDQTIFRIERVIRKTKDKALVKWEGYPDEFNSWVSLKDLRGVTECYSF